MFFLIPNAELVLVLKKICNEYYKACPKFIQDRVQKYSLAEMIAQIKGVFFSAEPVVQPSDGNVGTFPEIISNHMKNKTVIMNSQCEFMEGKSC